MKVPEVFPDSFRKVIKRFPPPFILETNQEVLVTATAGGPEDDEGEAPAVQAELEIQSQHVAQPQTGG